MRVLLVAAPMPGHVLPLVPLATALQEAGHDVVLATAGDGVAACPQDLRCEDVAPGFSLRRAFLPFPFRHPVLARREMTGRGEGRAVGPLLAGVGVQMADGTAALADRLRPDLVVHEPLAIAGAEAAARRAAPLVLVDSSLFPSERLFASTGRAYAARRRCRLPEPAEVLTTAPPSLVEPRFGARSGRPMRFVPATPDRPARPGFQAPGDRPRVLVSRSTADTPGRDRLMSTVVAAAARTELDVVLVRPDRSVVGRPLPGNVRTADWLPFPAVLPAAAGIVHHGGAGTLLTALAAGVPQLVVPGMGDRRANAEMIAGRGAGIAAELGAITPEALHRLVSDERLRASAREVAAEMEAMPHPAELVAVLEEVAAVSRGAA
jgi:UDP:flavonoid glycosyltransferase YjiC (YdhE family)